MIRSIELFFIFLRLNSTVVGLFFDFLTSGLDFLSIFVEGKIYGGGKVFLVLFLFIG